MAAPWDAETVAVFRYSLQSSVFSLQSSVFSLQSSVFSLITYGPATSVILFQSAYMIWSDSTTLLSSRFNSMGLPGVS